MTNMKKSKKGSREYCLQKNIRRKWSRKKKNLKKLEDMVKEYNELADRYNKLIDDKAELERKNREKAYEVMYQQEHSR